MDEQVSRKRVTQRVITCWLWEIATILMFAYGYWFFCDLLAAQFPTHLELIKYIVDLAAKIIIFTVLLRALWFWPIQHTYKAREIFNRDESPELWDIVHKYVKLARLKKCPRIYIAPDQKLKYDQVKYHAIRFGIDIFSKSHLIISDSLLKENISDQHEAIIAHKISHIKQRDGITDLITDMVYLNFSAVVWIYSLLCCYYGNDINIPLFNESFALTLSVGPLKLLFAFLTGWMASRFVRFALLLKKEYRADALAAGMMGTVKPITDMLEKSIPKDGLPELLYKRPISKRLRALSKLSTPNKN